MKIKHLRSRKDISNGGGVIASDRIDYGEIAINYHKGDETIFIKNDNDEIVSFKDNNFYEGKLVKITEKVDNLTDNQDSIIAEKTRDYLSNNINEAIKQVVDENLSMDETNQLKFNNHNVGEPIKNGKSTYQLYLEHSTDDPKLTEEEFATTNDWVYLLLKTI